MSIQKFKFTDLDIQESPFLLSISYEAGLWYYDFTHTINRNMVVLLMKSFIKEEEFLEEINSLQKICECSIISKNFDLKKIKTLNIIE